MSTIELGQFYDAHIGKIYHYFFYKALNRETAEDLASQCFLKFAKSISEKDVKNEKNFLFGIAKHVWLDHLRLKYEKLEQPLPEDDVTELVNESPEIHILEHLERVLPSIPEKQALILRLRFIDKLSITEIAHKLKKDVNYVSTTQKRAFKSIRKILDCTDAPTNIVGRKNYE